MSSKQSNILDYIVCCIGAFAERFTLSNAQAYRYLHHYQGLAFLEKHYGIEHTFSVDDVIDDMAKVCKSNGGALSV